LVAERKVNFKSQVEAARRSALQEIASAEQAAELTRQHSMTRMSELNAVIEAAAEEMKNEGATINYSKSMTTITLSHGRYELRSSLMFGDIWQMYLLSFEEISPSSLAETSKKAQHAEEVLALLAVKMGEFKAKHAR
jgi:hypothetical protein